MTERFKIDHKTVPVFEDDAPHLFNTLRKLEYYKKQAALHQKRCSELRREAMRLANKHSCSEIGRLSSDLGNLAQAMSELL